MPIAGRQSKRWTNPPTCTASSGLKVQIGNRPSKRRMPIRRQSVGDNHTKIEQLTYIHTKHKWNACKNQITPSQHLKMHGILKAMQLVRTHCFKSTDSPQQLKNNPPVVLESTRALAKLRPTHMSHTHTHIFTHIFTHTTQTKTNKL